MITEEEWLGRNEAIGQGLFVFVFFGVYFSAVSVDGWSIVAVLARCLYLLPGAVGALVILTRSSIVVGPQGVRRVWPSRFKVAWSEVVGVSLVGRSMRPRLGRESPVIRLADGRVINIWNESRPNGSATRIKVAIERQWAAWARSNQ